MHLWGDGWRGLRVALLLATLGLGLPPSWVWAHGEHGVLLSLTQAAPPNVESRWHRAPGGSCQPASPSGSPAIPPGLLLSGLAFAAWCALRPERRRPRAYAACVPADGALAWTVAGLFGVYLIALPPHLVHHLASPLDEGLKCTLVVQGNTSDQEGAEPVTQVVSPSLAGTVANCPAPPALVFPIPTSSGRSPPRLGI